MYKLFVSGIVLSLTTIAFGAESVPKKTLTFAWPASMTCDVTQKLEGGSDPIYSRYRLSSTREGENLQVSFSGFQVIDTFAGIPARTKAQFMAAEDSLGSQDAEREFTVTAAGVFVSAESLDNLRKRLSAGESSRKGGLSTLFMMAAGEQSDLDASYRLKWLDFIGNWVGLAYSPGETQRLQLEHKADASWLDYGVAAEVTVSDAFECARGGKPVQCVKIRTHFLPAFKLPNESEANSTRTSFDAEIVVEPENMIPHGWTDETHYRGGSVNGNLERRRARAFDCRAGS